MLIPKLFVDIALRSASPRNDRIDAGRKVSVLEKGLRGGPKKGIPAFFPAFAPRRHRHSFHMRCRLLTGNDRYRTAVW